MSLWRSGWWCLLLSVSPLVAAEETRSPLEARVAGLEQIEQRLGKLEEPSIRLDAQTLSLWEQEGDLARKLGQPQEAHLYDQKLLASWEAVLSNPKASIYRQLAALRQISELKFQQGRYLDVIQLCQRVAQEHPEQQVVREVEAEARHLMASTFLQAGDLELSINEYLAILRQVLYEPWHAFAKDQLAYLSLRKGDDATALSWYRAIIHDHPTLRNWSAAAHFSIAEYYRSVGEFEKADVELQSILDLYPDSPWAEAVRKGLSRVMLE